MADNIEKSSLEQIAEVFLAHGAELIVIGKKAIRKASNKLDIVPVPNQTMNKGAIEIFGTTCETTMIGYKLLRRIDE